DQGLITLRLEGQGDDRLEAARAFRDPRVLDAPGPVEGHESSVVRPVAALVGEPVVEEAVDLDVHEDALGAEPGAARALRIEPGVVDLGGTGGNVAGERQDRGFRGRVVHRLFSFFAKWASRRSSFSIQKRA